VAGDDPEAVAGVAIKPPLPIGSHPARCGRSPALLASPKRTGPLWFGSGQIQLSAPRATAASGRPSLGLADRDGREAVVRAPKARFRTRAICGRPTVINGRPCLVPSTLPVQSS